MRVLPYSDTIKKNPKYYTKDGRGRVESLTVWE